MVYIAYDAYIAIVTEKKLIIINLQKHMVHWLSEENDNDSLDSLSHQTSSRAGS